MTQASRTWFLPRNRSRLPQALAAALVITVLAVTSPSAQAAPLFKAPAVLYPAGGGAPSIGDLNGDGRPDLVMSNRSYPYTAAVLLGLGEGQFGSPSEFPVGREGSLTLVDLNRDGRLDLAVTSESYVSILLGHGDGTFAPASEIAVGSNRGPAAVGDLNGDGSPDLVTVKKDTISVRLGHGDGSFASGTDTPTVGDASLGATGDVNGDGKLDLVVKSQAPDPDDPPGFRILLGNGDGSFTSGFFASVVHDGSYGWGSMTGTRVGDIDGDGNLDLLFDTYYETGSPRQCNSERLETFLGRGDGTFQMSGSLGDYSVGIGDLNGDGRSDLVVGSCPLDGRASVMLSTGDGTFQASGGESWNVRSRVAIDDLDGDGRADMVAAVPGNRVAVMIGNGDGTFGGPGSSLGFSPGPVASGDLNADGQVDLVAAFGPSEWPTHSVGVLLGGPGGALIEAGSFDVGASPQGVALGDLNDDGRLDVAVADGGESSVSVLMGDGGGGFGPRMIVATQAGPWRIGIGDFDRDGHGDLVVLGNWGITALPGHGDGTFGPSRDYESGSSFTAVVVEDLNLDGVQDLALASRVTPAAVSVMLGDGAGGFLPRTPVATGLDMFQLAAGDLDGDGKVDLVAAGEGSILTLLGDGHGGFTVAAQVPVGFDPGPPAIGDLDGDGIADLALTVGQVVVETMLGVGDGTFGPLSFYGGSGYAPRWVGIADRTGDGRADLTVASAAYFYTDDSDDVRSGGGATIDVFVNGPDATPLPPVPVFTTANAGQPASIYLGDTFTITLGVRNQGTASDDGRIVVSFPSLTDPTDTSQVVCSTTGDLPGFIETAAGSTLASATCGPMTASHLVSEYVDADWRPMGTETNTVTFTVRPRMVGTFDFYVRSTMHATSGGCAFSNAVPSGGESGYLDQQGWPVKRFSVTVLPQPTIAAPIFVSAVTVVSDSIGLGQSLTISVAVRNDGAASDDGRIVVSFPSLTSPADSQRVHSTSGGDSPGYRELPAGAAVTDSSCQPMAAQYLAVEYVDSDWPRTGAETNTLSLSVQPREVGTFTIDVRSTMHTAGDGACAQVNAVPAGGEGVHTDPQGWSVRRFVITVLPAQPRPSFVGGVIPLPATAITLGGTFTLTATVSNTGPDTDDGRIVLSFPSFTAASDTQWVSASGGGDDVPGYREYPFGTPLPGNPFQPLPNCSLHSASYLSVEYADDSWAGDGEEANQLALTVKPRAVGTFPIYVRSTMRWTPRGPCAYIDSIPANLGSSTDQQGRRVGVVWVQVLPPAPPPVFTSVGIPISIVAGETATLTISVVNNGRATDDGRISLGFPTLTGATDGEWVSSGSTGDLPGYLERAAGSSLPDSSCHAMTSGYLTVEYADSDWASGETNTLTLNVQPQAAGTFHFDVHSTLRDVTFSGGPCGYVNGVPLGGSPTIDPQGWTVRRFAVTVLGPPGPLPEPTVSWEPIAVLPGGPSPRAGATAIYHPRRHAMVVYGGQSPDYQSDAWSLPLGGAGTWSQITPGGPAPIRRSTHSMILNPVDDQLVIFGGYYDGFLNDVQLMTLNGLPWWFPNPGNGTPPSARGGHAAVYDSVGHRMLVIGGFGGGLMNDVWEYSPPGAGSWRQLTPLGDPMPRRVQAAAIYDPVRNRVIVVGGDGGFFLNDVWALNLSGEPTWEELHPGGTAPSARREHTAIYDPVGDRIIVYGGFDRDRVRRGDVWALDLSGPPAWSLLVSSTPPPTSRSGHVAIYDAEHRRMVMVGGQVGDHQFSGEVWALNLDVPTPVALSFASSEVRSDLVRLTWSGEGAANLRASVQRSDTGTDVWTEIGSPTAEGSDRLVFEDRNVQAGARYGYRLAVLEDGQETLLDPVWVTVPRPAILSLAGASPNPSQHGVAVRFSLPGEERATLELFDLRGRRIASREVGSLGAGDHLVPLSDPRNLPAGVYLVRLTQGPRTLTAKACVVR